MEWSAFSEGFLESRRDAGASPHTLTAYAADLTAFAAWYTAMAGRPPEVPALTALDLTEYRASVARARKPATTNRRLGTIKTALGWAVESGVVPNNPIGSVRRVPEGPTGPQAVDRRIRGSLLREAQREGSQRDLALITPAGTGRTAHQRGTGANVGRRGDTRALQDRHGAGGQGW